MEDFYLETPKGWEIPLVEGQRLICIGDIHGDCQALRSALTVGGVFKATNERDEGSWVGGDTIVVQMGDVLDRGNEELACFRLLAKMSREANDAGGSVIILYGNHEVSNIEGNFSMAGESKEEYEDVIGRIIDDALPDCQWREQYPVGHAARMASYEPGGLLAEPLLSKFKVAVKVGKTVCVHGGLTPNHLDLYGGIESMNEEACNWIRGVRGTDGEYVWDLLEHEQARNNTGGYKNAEEAANALKERVSSVGRSMPIFMDGYSHLPLFHRGYSSTLGWEANKRLSNCLEMLDADRMVVAHTIQDDGISSAGDGKVWRVDVGMSRFIGDGPVEVLQIKMEAGKEVVTVLKIPGKNEQQP